MFLELPLDFLDLIQKLSSFTFDLLSAVSGKLLLTLYLSIISFCDAFSWFFSFIIVSYFSIDVSHTILHFSRDNKNWYRRYYSIKGDIGAKHSTIMFLSIDPKSKLATSSRVCSPYFNRSMIYIYIYIYIYRHMDQQHGERLHGKERPQTRQGCIQA